GCPPGVLLSSTPSEPFAMNELVRSATLLVFKVWVLKLARVEAEDRRQHALHGSQMTTTNQSTRRLLSGGVRAFLSADLKIPGSLGGGSHGNVGPWTLCLNDGNSKYWVAFDLNKTNTIQRRHRQLLSCQNHSHSRRSLIPSSSPHNPLRPSTRR